MRMLVQLKVVPSSSLRKRVRYADVGSAKSSSVKQSQEKVRYADVGSAKSSSVKQSQEKVRYADVGSAKSSSVKQSQEKGSVCGCWFS